MMRTTSMVFNALLILHYAAALCTDRFAADVTDNLSGAKTLAHQRQAIIPYMQFMCNGRITRLTVSTENQSGKPHYGPNPVTFQVWQPNGSTAYRLVAQRELPEGITFSGNDLLVNFSIPTGANLFFHQDDVIGYFQPDDLREKILNNDENNLYFAYELTTNTMANTFDINSASRRNSRKPLVKVAYEPVCVRPNISTITGCSPSDDRGSLIAINGTCTFSCDVGYKPQDGNGTIQCLPSGTWSHEPVCIMIECPQFISSSPLVQSSCNGRMYNSICALQCLNGASPNGNPQYICGNSSVWEPLGDQFTCTEIVASSVISTTRGATIPVSSTISMVTLVAALTVTNLASTTPIPGSRKDDSNKGAIAGGVVTAVVLLGILLALVVLFLWVYHKRRRRPLYFQRLISIGGKRKDRSEKESKIEDNIYCSIDQNMAAPLLATIYDVIEPDNNQHSATCKEVAPKLPPKRTSVKSKSPPILDSTVGSNDDYEFMLSASQVVAVAYSKNVVHWRKMVKTSQSKYCRPYEVPSALVEEIYEDPGTAKEKIYAYFEQKRFRKILSRDLRVEQEIGAGEFGTVYKGKWKNDSSSSLEVAIKTFNSSASESDKIKFLREAAIMGQFLHDNIVRLHGVVTEDNIMIVLEYMPKGDLEGLLTQIRSNKDQLESDGLPRKLLNFCRQIAAGLNYLTNKRFVHRDLAARNILVTSDEVCKIADFGMARDVTNYTYYTTSGGKLPVKWTAPEALLYHKYSVLSDIWSYGCVLYEIWSIGRIPFEDVTGDIALEKVSYGYRLPPPPGCPKGIYELMIDCWHGDPKGRPSFNVILAYLNGDLTDLLSWGTDDLEAAANSDVMKLGAPLSAGNNLYLTIQKIYRL